MSTSTLKLSISGIRGIIGESLNIPEIVYYTSAFRSLLTSSKPRILLARDTRLTGKMISNVVSSTLIASGVDVIDAGIIPTPTALYMTKKLNLHGAIIVSASHNPIEWNALKLVGKNGRFLDQESINQLVKNYKNKVTSFKSALKIGKYEKIDNAINEHVKRVVRFIDADKIRKANLKVACDYVNGAGLFATPCLLKALGVKEVSINDDNTGKFAHIAEPSPSSMTSLSTLVKKEKADIGFTQDPDADRLAIVLNDGTILSEEYTLALCAKYLWMVGKGNAAVNLSTSLMIDDIAKETSSKVFRTAIGEINVADYLRKNKLYFGGEGNGGVIVPEVTPGRDSLLGIALILELMATSKKTIKELVNELPSYKIVKDKIEVASFNQKAVLKKMKILFKNANIIDIDGIKVEFENSWVHVRSSNTENVVRIIAEAKTIKEAKEYVQKVKEILEMTK